MLTEPDDTAPDAPDPPGPAAPGVVTAPGVATAGTRIPRLPAGLVALGAFAIYAVYAIGRHLRFETGGYDLGIFEQAIRRYAHLQVPYAELKGTGVDLLGDHFHPILILVAPVYRIFPSPITLLVTQAAVLAFSVYQVTRLAQRELGPGSGAPPGPAPGGRLSRGVGVLIGGAYALSWGIAAAVGYDFHEVVFAVPLIVASLDNLLRRRYVHCALWAAALVLVKEDLTVTVAAIGVVLILVGQRKIGAILTGYGVAAFALIVGVVIPALNIDGHYAYWNATDIGGTTTHADPWHRLIGVLTGVADPWTKPFGIVLLLLPVVFIALRSPVALIAVPTVVWHLASANPAYSSMRYHYSVALMPIVFIAAIDGLRRAREREPAGWYAVALPWLPAAMLAIGLVFGLIGPFGQLVRPGWWHATPYGTAATPALRIIPRGASVAADNRMAAHLTATDRVFWVSTGLRDSTGRVVDVDWVIGNTTSGHFPIGPATRKVLFDALEACGYRPAYAHDGVLVLHRVDPAARGATLAACLSAHGSG